MTAQEKDRIECAIRHIQTAVDVDPWAAEIAVEAMKAQLSAEGTTSDLISRQAAIDALLKEFERDTPKAIRAKLTLENLPSAQPEIVMCKDCKHYTSIKRTDRWLCRCDEGLWQSNKDDFCSKAERRTDDADANT